ncbi:type I-C CRISPR-associated protein Cas5c [Rhodocyclus tenuis]|uniref:type I-C CRISPR-associated protein Cas5c n=1 Tax=Rhodocyclus tenuis TaxID=1066 RepID=UPI001902D9D5|nr:type I-C CRISPR-associated protein Cas5c [Rhodocyclus tenuis]MBK1680703.1 type I-C CRISPR-associated protein Cas5 [Rhodocyclus tenuis]
MSRRNSIEFRLRGRYALFADPLTRIGGEKCSYHIPTYEAIKGVLKSIYWKPTLIWMVDEVRVMKRIRTQTKGTKPQEFSGGNSLAIYTFLSDVEYQVRAHFEWNTHRQELAADRIEGKHYDIAKRMLERGGRQDIFLGTRDCQGYVEPCEFGCGAGELDTDGELGFGLMFHSFDYPDETGENKLYTRSWSPTMVNGVIRFDRPEDCKVRKFVREMSPKAFGVSTNQRAVDEEADDLAGQLEAQS